MLLLGEKEPLEKFITWNKIFGLMIQVFMLRTFYGNNERYFYYLFTHLKPCTLWNEVWLSIIE